jgi:uncharacterized membrane protein YfcA
VYDISLWQLVLISVAATFTSVIGGVAGYGTGALMPLLLVPIVGAEPVVPIIALASLATNASRATAFLQAIAWSRAALVLVAAIPTCALGAWGYTRLTGRGALLVIGTMMVASVPLRRVLQRRGFRLGRPGLAVAAAGWGVAVGGTTGAGAMLLALLMATGLEGAAVIATDAAISIVIGLVKVAVFGIAGAVTAQVIAVAVLIGVAAFPGAFIAKALVKRLPLAVHTAILDAVVVGGGALMIAGALGQ